MEEKCPKCGTWLAKDQNGERYCSVSGCPNYQAQIVPPPSNTSAPTGPLPPSNTSAPTGPLPPDNRGKKGGSYNSSGTNSSNPPPGNLSTPSPIPTPEPPPKSQGVPLVYPKIKTGESGPGLRRRVHCPFCNYVFRLYEADVVSTYTPGKVLDPPYKRRWGFAFQSPSLSGPMYTTEMACYQCPNCKNALPRGYEASLNISIAIIGGTSSGKTHYIAAILDQMEREGMTQSTAKHAIQFFPQTQGTKQALKKYRDVLQDLSQFEGTGRVTEGRGGKPVLYEPLVFNMVIRRKAERSKPHSVNLIFYDIAGEDIRDEAALSHFGWPILSAHAFIYLADPMCMPSVRDALPEGKKPQGKYLSLVIGSSSSAVFDSAVRTIQLFRRQSPHHKLSLPVAFMVAKSDLLDDVIPLAERKKSRYTFLDQVNYNGLVDVRNLRKNDKDLKRWLESIGEGKLVGSSLSCRVSCYFAVSATGSAPDATGKFPMLEPRRCLDPLMWILWRFAS